MSDYKKLLEKYKKLKKETTATVRFLNEKNASLWNLAVKRREEIEDLKYERDKLKREVIDLSLLLDAKIRGDK